MAGLFDSINEQKVNTYVLANLVDAMNSADKSKFEKANATEMVKIAVALEKWGDGAKDKSKDEIEQATKTAKSEAILKAVSELNETTEKISNSGEKSGIQLLAQKVMSENRNNPVAVAEGLISINHHVKTHDFDKLYLSDGATHDQSSFTSLSQLHDALDTVHQDMGR